jgi:hypothetical protein|tara:strand:+ start:411 stop:557 length:147 start_codon:yes stop_codon:yes gene_type:complete
MVGWNYKLIRYSGKGILRQIYHPITLDMWTVFKGMIDLKLGFSGCSGR